VNVFTCAQTPQYTDGMIPMPDVSVYPITYKRVVCNNSLKKPRFLLRIGVFAWLYDRIRSLYFDAKLAITPVNKTPNDSIRGEITVDSLFEQTDNQMSIYATLYTSQCRALSELVEMMVAEGNMTETQHDFIQRRLLAGLNDRAKAALVIRALYGTRKDRFGAMG
jgi:hypothetical protein